MNLGMTWFVKSPPIWLEVFRPSSTSCADVAVAIRRIIEVDPTLSARADIGNSKVFLGGPSEDKLSVAAHALNEAVGERLRFGALEVDYRQTILNACSIEYTVFKDPKGRRRYAKVALEIEPCTDVDPIFESEIDPPLLPQDSVAGVERGVASVSEAGPVHHKPLTGLRVVVERCA